MSYNTDLAQRIDEYLRSQEWRFDFDAVDGEFTFGMNIDSKVKKVDIRIFVDDEFFTVYATAPMRADENDFLTMRSLGEYFSRANYGLRTGNFEIDFNDGEMRYKATLFVPDQLPTLRMVERVVDIPFVMWRRYGNGMLSVLYGGGEPAKEIELAESQT
ncbi:MAG: YbjN domain-containing protein [Propionibacteriaceae bacterium]|jgi:hypothetical protein|nr:YbjN domain-containing protein [Propionibacteriaceae bacterium]